MQALAMSRIACENGSGRCSQEQLQRYIVEAAAEH